MRYVTIIWLVFFLWAGTFSMIHAAQPAGVFINMPCDSVVREEFNRWKDDPRIRQLFSSIILLDDIPQTIPMKENILITIKELYQSNPQSVFFFIYGIKSREKLLLTLDYQELTQNLFTVGGQYIANEIVIMDINNSFQGYRYELPANQTCRILRAELNNGLSDLAILRLQLATDTQPLSIDRLTSINQITLFPLIQQTIYTETQQTVNNMDQNNYSEQSNSSITHQQQNGDKFFDNVNLPPVSFEEHQSTNMDNQQQPESNVDQPSSSENYGYGDNSTVDQNVSQANNQSMSPPDNLYQNLNQDQQYQNSQGFSDAPPADSFDSTGDEDMQRQSTLPIPNFYVNPVDQNNRVYYVKRLKRYPKRETHILQIFSNDNFLSHSEKSYPYSFDNLLIKNFYSKYFYVFSHYHGNHVEVYHKNEGNMIYQTPIKILPNWRELEYQSTEYSSPHLTILGFRMPGQAVGLCIDKNDRFYFSELDCQGQEIESMTIAPKNRKQKQDGLLYILDHALRFHPITTDAYQTTADDTIWASSREYMNDMFGAKLIWRYPNVFILAKNVGLFWFNKTLKLLYIQKGIRSHHVDYFYSGDGKRLGFVWSGIDMDNNCSVWLGIEKKDKSFKTFDLTDLVLEKMNVSPSKNTKASLPIIYLKDRSRYLDQLHGALIYNSNNHQSIVKTIDINIVLNHITLKQKGQEKRNSFVRYEDIKVLAPFHEKLIVHIGFNKKTNSGKVESNFFQLFSFPK